MRNVRLGLCGLLALGAVVLSRPAHADGCRAGQFGEGKVGAIVDARTLRLADGREILLAGVEVASAKAAAALRAIAQDQDVTLHGQDDAPDRYGRQAAFVYVQAAQVSLQAALVSQGLLLASGSAIPAACGTELAAAEAGARVGRLGVWSGSGETSVIKNAESHGDILTGMGQFAVVEGRVVSVREAGATVYVNFGRRWTRDFAVTIPKRVVPAFDAAGLGPKSLENRQVRVRGWVDARGGPRIEAIRAEQIEVIDRDRGGGRKP